MDKSSLEALKAREAVLLRELEIRTSQKNNLLQKHRQVLLNAAHFLRLYHQSSQKIVDELKNHSYYNATDKIETKHYIITTDDILKEHGLRLLWNAFYNSEFTRSLLIFEFLKSSKLFKEEESLNYFKNQFIEKVYKIILSGNDSDFAIQAILLDQKYADSLLDQIKSKISSKQLENSISSLAQFYKKLTTNNSLFTSPFHLFIEKDSDYSEFPQLKKFNVENVELRADLNSFKTQLKQIITEELLRNLETTKDFDIEVLKQLELEEYVIETISNKVNELKARGTSEKMKFELSDLFDKLMKSIQAAVRANEIKIDATLHTRKDSVSALLAESPNPEIESILQPILQTLKNKSNIIFTIHRNELNALNSKRENNPIGSRLYLAIVLIRKLFEVDQDFKLLSTVSELSKLFMDAWVVDLQKSFTHLSESHNEIFALSWLSIHFISLNVEFKDAELVTSSLGFHFQEIKRKYSNQAALLSGLFESEKVPSPALKSSEVTETRQQQQLLPHFNSL